MSVGILLNGTKLDVKIDDDYLICADGGYNLLKDRIPNCIIGDLDSIVEVPKDVQIIKHNPEKNYTDGELAVMHALKLGYTTINIYGALGGRIDHILGNLALLALACKNGATAAIRASDCDIYFARGSNFKILARKGATISILPFGGTATVVSSQNLYYPLTNLMLFPEKTRGISNIATSENPSIVLGDGCALVVVYKI